MTIRISEEMEKEMELFQPYLIRDGFTNRLKDDTPLEIVERYKIWNQKYEEMTSPI